MALPALAVSTQADTIQVRNTHDAGPGSLRRAINQASPGDTIVVPAGTYRLTSGELLIDKALTIHGRGASRTEINAGGDSRVFDVTSLADPVEISQLAVAGGRDQYGGGIRNAGNLTLNRVFLHNNRAAGDPNFTAGGGIANTGTLKVVRSVLRENRTSAVAEGFGGAISAGFPGSVSGPVTITQSRIVENAAPEDGFGGAVGWQTNANAEDAGVKIVKSTFSSNTATGGSNFSAPGGAIFFNPYELVGGVELELVVRRSTFDHNRAVTPGQESWGGAIGFQGRALTSGGSTPLTLVNNTLTQNTAGGQGGSGFGGAVWIDAVASDGGTVPMTLLNDTIARNTAAGSGEGGGIDFSVGGLTPPAAPTVLNAIVAQNSAAMGPDCNAPVTSAGYNIERHQSCGFNGPGDQQDTNPLLGVLAKNGGPTQTMALRPGSPAINRGTNTNCPGTDQRGVPRPQGPRCDIGAFEVRR
ncbi:MAG: choice-of-anchor Q domain-containing protein [Solirubrobacterales bacterium]